jgi:hypothetical protein
MEEAIPAKVILAWKADRATEGAESTEENRAEVRIMALVTFAGPETLPNPTQDQLDELETLIQRMLELPVVEQESIGSEPALQVIDHAAPASDPPAFEVSPPHRPFPGNPAEISGTSEAAPSSSDTFQMVDDLPPVKLRSSRSRKPARSRHSKPHSIGKEAAAQGSRLLRFLLFPLTAMNWVYDLYTLPFGLPGRWLRGSVGRNVLGVTGLALLAIAIGCGVVEWMGWF